MRNSLILVSLLVFSAYSESSGINVAIFESDPKNDELNQLAKKEAQNAIGPLYTY